MKRLPYRSPVAGDTKILVFNILHDIYSPWNHHGSGNKIGYWKIIFLYNGIYTKGLQVNDSESKPGLGG